MPNNYVSLIDVKGDVYSIKDISIHNTLGVANGIATLDETGKVPNEQLSIATQTNDGLMSKEDKELLNNIPKQIIVDNLLPYPYSETTYIQYDVTWTDNGDGTITANGTNTDTSKTSQFYFNIDTPLDLRPNTTYTLSGCSGGGATSTYAMRIIINYRLDGQVQYRDLGDGVTFTTPSNYQHCRIMIDISSGVTVNNLIFKPMLEKGSIAHPYQPYILSRQKLREDINNAGTGGSAVSVTQSLTTGTKVGTITVDGNSTDLYAPTNTDTKNTAGSTESSSKLFLIGATSQAANPQTYSHDTAYIGTNGKLYSNSKEVVNLSDSQALTNKTYNGYTLGDACARGVDTGIRAGSENLVTGQAVLSALPKTFGADAGTSSGLVPSSQGGTTKYLREDGTWQVPPTSSTSVVNNLTSTSTTAALSANQGKVLNEKIDGLRAHAYSLLIDEIVASTSATNYTTYNSRSLANYDIISIRIGPSESSVYDTLTIPIAYFKKTGVTYYGRLDGSRMMTIKYVNNTTVALSITSGTAVINMDGFTLDNVSF